jgi:hypothetical protein
MAGATNTYGGKIYNTDGTLMYPTAPSTALQPTPTVNTNGGAGGSMQGLNSATSGPGMDDIWVASPDGSGAPMIRQDAYETERLNSTNINAEQERMQLQARLQAEGEQRRLGMLSTLRQSVDTGQVTRPIGGDEQEAAARAAAFARAKEQAGSTATASLRALQDVLANSGRMGGSLEAGMTADVVGGAGNQVNEFTRDQLMMDLNRAADIGDMNYQGAIQQRGQNLGMLPSLASLISASGGLY